MTTIQPTEFQERKEAVPPFQIHIVSYRIGEKYFSKVDNVDPGATIARAEGATREEAESVALTRAKERVGKTVVREV